MNRNDQMREALRLLYHVTPSDDASADLLVKVEDLIKQSLAHVNETPKNEHDSADVLKPAKLVRLNDDALINIYLECKAEWKATNRRQRQRIAAMFGNAIMNAMERANK